MGQALQVIIGWGRAGVKPARLLLLASAIGCARPPEALRVDDALAAPTELTAILAGSNHIELRWKDNSTREAGYFVEYTTSPEDEFILLNAVPRDATFALHPDLAPDTRFLYRVTPYFGEASAVAVVTTGKTAGDDASPVNEPVPGRSGSGSLREDAREAAPTELRAVLVAPTQVRLEWKDRSRDEDGSLVEASGGFDDFRVLAYVPPNVTSYEIAHLPAGQKCYFRVRAFYRGRSSPIAERRTPAAAS